jgi:hypothetical protein
VESAGFALGVAKDVALDVGTNMTINLNLQIASAKCSSQRLNEAAKDEINLTMKSSSILRRL